MISSVRMYVAESGAPNRFDAGRHRESQMAEIAKESPSPNAGSVLRMSKNRPHRSLGEHLRTARMAAGLSQAELAAQTGLNRSTAVAAEAGRGGVAVLIRLAAGLGLEVTGHSLSASSGLGGGIAALRRRRQISRRALAVLADVSVPTLTAIESGKLGHTAGIERVAASLGAGLRLSPIGRAAFWAGAGTSSAHHGWHTPSDLLLKLYPLVGGRFDLDPCAPSPDRKSAPVRCRIRFTMSDDGLMMPWIGSVFCNPPFGRGISRWVAKAHGEAAAGRARPVMALLPVRPDTGWWHDHVAGYADVVMLRGRLKFSGCDTAAPFPSALVVWAADAELRRALRDAFPDAWHVASGNGGFRDANTGIAA